MFGGHGVNLMSQITSGAGVSAVTSQVTTAGRGGAAMNDSSPD